MWDNFKFRSDRNIGPVVAACIVIMLGGGCFLVVGTLAYPRDIEIPILTAAGFIFCGLFLVWLLQDRPKSTLRERFSWIGSKRHREGMSAYEPQLIRQRPVRYGTKRPPTIDEIREVKESANNWVPSNAVSGRKSVRSR